MRKIIFYISALFFFFFIPFKTFAQLEKKTIYAYNKDFQLVLKLECSDKIPIKYDYTAKGNSKYSYVQDGTLVKKSKGLLGYWRPTKYKGIYELYFIECPGGMTRYDAGTWYFCDFLNIVTEMDPYEILLNKHDITINPWKYGLRAFFNEKSKNELSKIDESKRKNAEKNINEIKKIKKEIFQNKHLYTQGELDTLMRFTVWGDSSYSWQRKDMRSRQELYDKVNQNPQIFLPEDYYKIINGCGKTHPIMFRVECIRNEINDRIKKRENKDNLFNNLIGEYKPEKGKGTECIITNKNDQLYLTLKYKREVIYDGYITGEQATNVQNRKRNDQRLYSNYGCSNINVKNTITMGKMFIDVKTLKNKQNFKGLQIVTEYHFYLKDGNFILDLKEYYGNKLLDSVTFIKK